MRRTDIYRSGAVDSERWRCVHWPNLGILSLVRKKITGEKMTRFTTALFCLTIAVLACSAPAATMPKIATQTTYNATATSIPSYPTFTVTPVRLDVSGCWNVRSSPSAADDSNILRTVCDEDVYFLRWAENGFIEIVPLGKGHEYICNQADPMSREECK